MRETLPGSETHIHMSNVLSIYGWSNSNALDTALIDGLSFSLAKARPFITKVRICLFHPQGSNQHLATQ